MLRRSRVGTLLAVVVATAVPSLQAQRVTPGTYAITDVRIVPVAGPVIEKGTLVIRDGLIAAVGATITAPAEARVVDGTGLTIYPGLIDAYSSLGLRTAPAVPGGGGPGGGGGFGGGPAPARPAGAPNSRQLPGLQPEVRAIDQVVDNADFAVAHAAGITTALTAPQGRIYEGQSALISLGSGDFAAMAIRPVVALHVGFQGLGGGVYPGSLMGVFAALRQSLIDARYYRDQQAAYARGPRTARRPDYDPSLEALQPVLAGTMPVVFRANTQREIERALDLAKEFGLKAMIGGGAEAHRVADRLKAENVPVLLSVNFPRRTAAAGPDAEPEPIRVLRERVQAPKTPAALQQAGVRFALQAGGNQVDYVANLRRAVAGGLAAEATLRAATLGAAELLGAADRLGSIEVGKIANLTVVKGSDLFAADARVSGVWIDGRPIALAAPAPMGRPMGPMGQRPGYAGTWTMTVALEGAEYDLTLTLRDENGQLAGAIAGALGAAPVVQARMEPDGTFAFAASVTTAEGTEEAWFRGTLVDGAFTGRVDIVGQRAGRFAGTRQNETTTSRER